MGVEVCVCVCASLCMCIGVQDVGGRKRKKRLDKAQSAWSSRSNRRNGGKEIIIIITVIYQPPNPYGYPLGQS